MELLPYRREAAEAYARYWAYGRNPDFYDYETIGGDCTNFASQCIYAGTGVMNFTPTYGWYYISADDKAPAWTGVMYLHNFLIRPEPSPGPVCTVTQDHCKLAACAHRDVDFIQISDFLQAELLYHGGFGGFCEMSVVTLVILVILRRGHAQHLQLGNI